MRQPDGSLGETLIMADAGWWVAAPEVVGEEK